MKAEAIALNLRGITHTYEVDPFPAEHRIMEPLFFSQPTVLLIPLPSVNSVLTAPVNTRIQQASLQIPAYLLCHRAGYWNSNALRHRRLGGIWTMPLYLLLLYRHHDPFFSDPHPSLNRGSTGVNPVCFMVMVYFSTYTVWSILLRPESKGTST